MEWSVDGVPEESCPALGFPDSPLKGKVSIFNEHNAKSISWWLKKNPQTLIITFIWHFHETSKITLHINHRHWYFSAG